VLTLESEPARFVIAPEKRTPSTTPPAVATASWSWKLENG
jgi:hypothetical protein